MKTMMKRFGVAALLMALLLSMTACGGETPAADQPAADNAATQPANGNGDQGVQPATPLFFDSSKYTVTAEDPYDYGDGEYSVAYKYALNGTADFTVPADLSLDGTAITLMSTTVKDLMDKGWTLESGTKAGDAVSSTSICKAVAKSANGKYAMIYAGTAGKTDETFENCVITDVDVAYESAVYYNGDEGADFVLAGALKRASVAADVVNKLGNPTNITITEWHEGGQYQYATVLLYYDEYQAKNSVGVSIKFVVDAQSSTMDSMRVTIR